MSDHRNIPRDLVALGLFAVVIFLGLALVTYDPADAFELVAPLGSLYRPDTLVYPPNSQIRNLCGFWGALTADVLLTAFGIGAYYVTAALATVDVLLLRRRTIDEPWRRGVGIGLTLVGLTTLGAIVVPGLSPGPVIGSGGYLGAVVRGLLETHLALGGAVILSAGLFVGGLFLSTDFALFQVARTAVAGGVRAGQRVAKPKTAKSAENKPAHESNAPPAESSDPNPRPATLVTTDLADSVPVKIRAKKKPDEATSTPAVSAAPAATAPVTATPAATPSPAPPPAPAKSPIAAKPAPAAAPTAAPASATEPVDDETPAKKTRADKSHGAPNLRVRRLDQAERDQVMTKLDEGVRASDGGEYVLPTVDLLKPADEVSNDALEQEVLAKAKILEKTFADFGFEVKVVEIETGPVIAQYEVELEAGLRLSKITGLADDLAIALRVPSVRIVAPIPGKNTVGIEVPNETRQIVRLREVIEEGSAAAKKMRIPLFLGKDVSGDPLVVDLSTLPHLLIAGRTGTGKSVCLNAIISSILMTRRPDEVRMLMIDPKMVELCGYGRLPHLMHPVVTDMRKAEAILAWAVDKMEERYALLARAGVRHLSSYNQLGEAELMRRLQPENDEQRQSIPLTLPFIVIVADEMADLMMTAGKEVEQHIIRLAQKSRAVGIHLILATQKPTVDVITGLIKSNLPARIAFQVASRTDSRVVLDEMGADKLLGNGDMLFLYPNTSSMLRGQGTYLSDDEINRVVDVVSTGEQHFVHELVNIQVGGDRTEALKANLKKRDELYEQAVDVVVREGRGSVSLLQRALGIGYGRAARLVDFMAEDGIVGEYNGSQAREVLLSVEDWERMQSETAADDKSDGRGKSGARPKNKVRPAEPPPRPRLPKLDDAKARVAPSREPEFDEDDDNPVARRDERADERADDRADDAEVVYADIDDDIIEEAEPPRRLAARRAEDFDDDVRDEEADDEFREEDDDALWTDRRRGSVA